MVENNPVRKRKHGFFDILLSNKSQAYGLNGDRVYI